MFVFGSFKTMSEKKKLSEKKKASQVKTDQVKTSQSKTDSTKKITEAKESKNYFKSFNFLMDLSRAFVIVAVLLFLVVCMLFIRMQANYSYFVQKDDILKSGLIIEKGKNSFGNLRPETADSSSTLCSGQADRATTGDAIETSLNQEANLIVDVIAPKSIKYNYIYRGGNFDLFNPEEKVYKKVPLDLSKKFINKFSSSDFLIGTEKFTNLGVSNFSLVEDRDYGYNISYYIEDGSIALYKNWKRWPRVEEFCGGWQNTECIDKYRLSFNQVLPNEEVLAIANKFLTDYGVDLGSYGEGEVSNDWLRYYFLSDDKDSYYIPDSVHVVYPLQIDGKTVYEEYGAKSGLSLDVDNRARRVSELFSLSFQNYESSAYKTERDQEKILSIAKNGGFYPYYDYAEGDDYEVIDIELGTPSLELVRIWQYDNIKMTNQELYVPAYVFPVVSESRTSYFDRKNIVVPAVSDFFWNEAVG